MEKKNVFDFRYTSHTQCGCTTVCIDYNYKKKKRRKMFSSENIKFSLISIAYNSNYGIALVDIYVENRF